MQTPPPGPSASPIGRFVSRRAGSRSRWRRTLARVAYWLLVLAVSLILVFLLLAFFEARDRGDVGAAGDDVVLATSGSF